MVLGRICAFDSEHVSCRSHLLLSAISSNFSKALLDEGEFLGTGSFRHGINSFCLHDACCILFDVHGANFFHLFKCLRETIGLLVSFSYGSTSHDDYFTFESTVIVIGAIGENFPLCFLDRAAS
jgi:hypothetical protein